MLELPIEEGLIERVGLVVFNDWAEVVAMEGKVGEEEFVEELSITEAVGVFNGFESAVEVLEKLKLASAEELAFIKEDKDVEDLTVDWRVVFEEAFAWWTGVTVFLLDE